LTKIEASVGDVFAIPIDESRWGAGQVVAEYGKSQIYLAAYDYLVESPTRLDPNDVVSRPLLLLALSFDGLIYAGEWPLVGRVDVPTDMPLPAYKLGSPDQLMVVDYSGKRERTATVVEADALPFRTTVAAVRLEKALQAIYGVGEWNPEWDELRPQWTTTAKFFGD